MTSPRGVGLRSQILLIFLGTAVVPLGLLGFWLAQTATRSGEDLLRNHLDASADRFATAAARRWEYRRADIALIAGNEATVRAVSVPRISGRDRDYLDALAANVEHTIPSIELRDSKGALRWTSTPESRAARARIGPASTVPSIIEGPFFRVETRIIDSSGRTIGHAITALAVSALVPPESARSLVPGARLAVRESGRPVVLVPLDTRVAFPSSEHFRLGGERWLAVYRRLARPPIEFTITAPVTPYVAPFKRAAMIGVAALLIVTVLAVSCATALASRATRPLQDLATASDAVTGGNLEQRIDVGGPTEVRRVAAAFNVMIENLRATLDALSRRSAMAAVGEFATSLSHDVRNALTSIRVDLDRLSIRDLHDPVATGLVSRLLNSVARLDAAVTGALRVARRGQTPLEDVDVRGSIRAAADVVRGTIAALPAEIVLRLPVEPIWVRGDAAALQQLFANLLFNAAQAMSAGGVARVIAESIESEAQITIADDGAGISAGNLARLNTPFFSTKVDGTGLGLPIARQIVAAHGGSLSIESEEGQGTTVRVRLPLGTNRSPDLNASRRESTVVG